MDPEAVEMAYRAAMHQAGAAALTRLPGIAARIGPKRTSFSEMEPNGSGTLRTSTFPAPFRSSICFMRVNTSGKWPELSNPAIQPTRRSGFCATSPNSTAEKSKSWSASFAQSTLPRLPHRHHLVHSAITRSRAPR